MLGQQYVDRRARSAGRRSPFWDKLLGAVEKDVTLGDLTRTVWSIEGAFLMDRRVYGSSLLLTDERKWMWQQSEEVHRDDTVAGFAYQGNPGEGVHAGSHRLLFGWDLHTVGWLLQVVAPRLSSVPQQTQL